MRGYLTKRAVLLVLVAGIVPACGGGGGGGIVIVTLPVGAGGASFVTNLGGGSAAGGTGGTVLIDSSGPIRLGVNPAPAPPAAPPVPTVGTVYDTAALAAGTVGDTFSQGGTIRIEGDVEAPPVGGGTFTLVATTGDIVISGRLSTSNNQNLVLRALTGSVYVTGTVRTHDDNFDSGVHGGDLLIDFNDVGGICFVSGLLDARGEPHPFPGFSSGNGGNITIDSGLSGGMEGDILVLGGTLDASGADALHETGTHQAGDGGSVFLRASNGNVGIFSTVRSDGGDATGADTLSGGTAGDITIRGDEEVRIDADLSAAGGDATAVGMGGTGGDGRLIHVIVGNTGSGAVELYGTLHFEGGSGSADGGAASGGDAGGLQIGMGGGTPPTSVDMPEAVWDLSGGSSNDVPGTPGSVDLSSTSAEIVYRGTTTASGGSGGDNPGVAADGGTFDAVAGAGGVTIEGSITVDGSTLLTGTPGNGGAITVTGTQVTVSAELRAAAGETGNGHGASGGGVVLYASGTQPNSIEGTIDVSASSAGVAGTGGFGGVLAVQAEDGDVLLNADVAATGGNGMQLGGGGIGGGVLVHSDVDGDTVAGDITISGSIVLDAGSGLVSGGARNDGANPTVGTFLAGNVALEVDADGNNDDLNEGMITVTGLLQARGRANNGSGGDVIFDGTGTDGLGDLPATADFSGTGTGLNGDVEFQ